MSPPSRTRKHRRIGVELRVAHESVASFRADPCDNLSAGGVFIRTTRPLPIGTLVYLAIELDQGPSLRVTGEVAWHRPAQSEAQPAGMGIAFTSLGHEQRERLEAYLARACPTPH